MQDPREKQFIAGFIELISEGAIRQFYQEISLRCEGLGKHQLKLDTSVVLAQVLREVLDGDPTLDGKITIEKGVGLLNLLAVVISFLNGKEPTSQGISGPMEYARIYLGLE